MNLSSKTLNNFITAVEKVGEKDVNAILETLNNREKIVIDEVVELCSKKLDINKSFLNVKSNRVKTDLISTIVYILRVNNISPASIKEYFKGYTIRINEMFMYIRDLSDNIPDQLKLKSTINIIESESELIFNKYYFKN